jgi:hypothetical protein
MIKPIARKTLCITRIAGILMLCAAVGPLTAKDEPLPEISHDGLVLVPDSTVAAAYLLPEADFSAYTRVMILDTYVAFRKNWERDQQRATGTRIKASDMNRIKEDVATLFEEVLREKLTADNGYPIVDEADYDVLLLRAAIIDLDVTAPDLKKAGRSMSFSTTAGAATLYLELFDSVSGAILARAVDRKTARRPGSTLTWSNRVSNSVEAKRIFGRWADLLRKSLDEFHAERETAD